MTDAHSFSDSVRNVIIIASSSRGGSSVFAEVLRRCPAFLHLRAEMNPILHLAGLCYPKSQSDSDALSAHHLNEENKSILDRELSLECGNPYLGPLLPNEIEDYAKAITRRLYVQWPAYDIPYASCKHWLLSTFEDLKRSFAWTQSEVRDPQLFWCVFLSHVRKEYPQINPYYYDLNPDLVRKHFPSTPVPEGPPSSQFIEEPPFIIPVPLKEAKEQEFAKKALVIKTPSNAYRLDFLKALFPNAQLWILHLTRNAPHSINGLYDGWCHRGFFSHHLPERLHMEGYSDRFPDWGKSWWNFDLPPNWQEYTSKTLVEVCAFQWYAAHEATIDYVKRNPDTKYLRIRSEDVLSTSEDTRRATAEKLGNWLQLDAMDSLKSTMLDVIEPVMATHPPQKNRWLEKSDIINPVLKQKKVKDMLDELGYSEESSKDILITASFGGPTWVPRSQSHSQELASGLLWSTCGVSEEWAPLKSVLLSWPQDSLDTDDLDASLLLRKVDLKRLRTQTENLASFYESFGIRVHLYKPQRTAPPNLLFMRDTFFMTPQGAFLGRLGGQARAGEERFVAEALASHGIPIARSILGRGCFEGADALWLSEKKVLIAGGFRTNEEAIRQLSSFLEEFGVSTLTITLPRGTQHLLGAVNFLNHDKAVCRAELFTPEMQNCFEKNGISMIPMSPSEEVIHKRALNFVTLRPNCIVMPSDCPATRKIYEKNGVECFEADVSEYINAGGGLGCLTGIVERSHMNRGAR